MTTTHPDTSNGRARVSLACAPSAIRPRSTLYACRRATTVACASMNDSNTRLRASCRSHSIGYDIRIAPTELQQPRRWLRPLPPPPLTNVRSIGRSVVCSGRSAVDGRLRCDVPCTSGGNRWIGSHCYCARLVDLFAKAQAAIALCVCVRTLAMALVVTLYGRLRALNRTRRWRFIRTSSLNLCVPTAVPRPRTT